MMLLSFILPVQLQCQMEHFLKVLTSQIVLNVFYSYFVLLLQVFALMHKQVFLFPHKNFVSTCK